MARDMTVHIIAGDIRVTIGAEDVSYSSDVADDMVRNAVTAFREAWDIAGAFAFDGEEDDAEAETVAGDDDAD